MNLTARWLPRWWITNEEKENDHQGPIWQVFIPRVRECGWSSPKTLAPERNQVKNRQKHWRWTLDNRNWTFDIGQKTFYIKHRTIDILHFTLDIGHTLPGLGSRDYISVLTVQPSISETSWTGGERFSFQYILY